MAGRCCFSFTDCLHILSLLFSVLFVLWPAAARLIRRGFGDVGGRAGAGGVCCLTRGFGPGICGSSGSGQVCIS